MDERTEESPELPAAGRRPSRIRVASVFVRAAHLLSAAVVGGAIVLGVEGAGGHAWWAAAAMSGALLLAAEIDQHRELWREPCGGATLLKLLLVGGALAAPAAGAWLVSAAFVVAALGAHFPKRWRHRRLF